MLCVDSLWVVDFDLASAIACDVELSTLGLRYRPSVEVVKLRLLIGRCIDYKLD